MLLLCCLVFPAAMADDNGGNGNDKPIPEKKKIVLLPFKGLPNRPNAPSRVYIECEYCAEYIEFTLPEGVTAISVVLTNGDDTLMDVATVESPVIYLPTLYGEYEMTCTTDDGRDFYGTLYF